MIDPTTEPGDGILFRCDTVMMVQAPDGTLAFSDDGGSANLSLVTLPRMAGAYKVWAGAYSEGLSCQGEVRVADADFPCPGLTQDAVHTASSASETWTVTAGGPRDVRGCAALAGLVESELALGFIDFAPTLTFPTDLNVEADMNLSVEAVCDTVLISLEGDGTWRFSDDTGESLNPSLVFAAEGFSGAKVWVGTYDIATCDVDLKLGQQADTTCPSPNLPAEVEATLGGEVQLNSDGAIDLSACAQALDGGVFSGFTSLSPAASLTFDSIIDTPSLTMAMSSTCDGQVLAHQTDEDGLAVWTMMEDLPFGSDTLTLVGPGTLSLWLVNETSEPCAGTLALVSDVLSCPNPALPGKEAYTFPLSDLAAGQRLPLVAGGKTDIENCTVPGLSANGTYIDRPDFVIDTDTRSSLIFESEGQCDTVLIVHDGAGTWHFSDDDAPDSNGGYITLSDTIPGPYQVWVGTYGEDLCEGALLIKRGLFKD